MTISGIYTQQITLSLSTVVPEGGALPTVSVLVTSGVAPAQGGDVVEISPEAAQAAEDAALPPADPKPALQAVHTTPVVYTAPAPAPAASVQTPSEAPAATPGRGDALFAALDGDGDGSITADEFLDGARRLLRRGGHHGHHGPHGHDDADRTSNHGWHGRAGFRLTRRLERLFDRLDANNDGRVDKGELSDALNAVRGPRGRHTAAAAPAAAPAVAAAPVATPVVESPAQPAPAANPPASGTLVQVTVVSIAIQQYTTSSLGSGDTATLRATA